jgi:uncharacterized protein (TIGR02266 family)
LKGRRICQRGCDVAAGPDALKSRATTAESPFVARYVEVVAHNRGAERRTAPRVELQIEVGLSSDSSFYTGLTQDISTGGVFVATHQLHRVGQHVTVHLALPGRPDKITVESEVRWVREISALNGSHGTTGMGLRFLELTPSARQAIDRFLDTHDSLFHDED